jgi:hypothetical protein
VFLVPGHAPRHHTRRIGPQFRHILGQERGGRANCVT